MLGMTSSSYISYGALNPGKTPCSLKGASYYNCKPGAKANPYSRSCSAIDQCQPNALPLGWISSLSGCRGSIAECLAGDEFDLGSQASRRILATSGYISYGALRRDTTPCSRRGASYYNCRPGAEANPYSRSCSTISQCRG
ncbi:hypothetical protein ZIOFF_056292 [Zingiber officinale]|uniref:Uncharacterized protein n=1 Tax=Zingiber officinale TaxID=94328 RepID=A0A8J5KFA6_ZINOF|nr:hypothetical protein ZIOFF_056292 [Zingiber officinale]